MNHKVWFIASLKGDVDPLDVIELVSKTLEALGYEQIDVIVEKLAVTTVLIDANKDQSKHGWIDL